MFDTFCIYLYRNCSSSFCIRLYVIVLGYYNCKYIWIISDPWKRKQITASEETNNSLKKCLSSPSLNTTSIERDNNRIAGEVMKHEVKALVKGRARYDIAAPHDDNESEPASTSVLKMFEKAHRRNYSDEFKLKDLTLPSKEVKVSKSQSVPASPRTSPTLRRRHLSGDKHDSPSNVSLTSKVMEHFTGSGLPKTGQIDSKPLSSVTSLYQWSSTTKVKVESRDMNVFAPTSF